MRNKKEGELGFIEHVRRICDWIPQGPLVPHEEPDVLLDIGTQRLGIEVTQLHEIPPQGATPRREVEAFHLQVMETAERLYAASGDSPLDVLVYFGYEPLRNVTRTAEELIEFVRTHPPADGCETFAQGAYAGFAVVRVSEPFVEIGRNRWRCGEGGSVPILGYAQLADVIRRKNVRVPNYRRNADQVWLLIASPIAPFSSSFSVPREVHQWRFVFDFDKVLLYSWEDGLIELTREE